jgi:hypothetical protein
MSWIWYAVWSVTAKRTKSNLANPINRSFIRTFRLGGISKCRVNAPTVAQQWLCNGAFDPKTPYRTRFSLNFICYTKR